VTFEFGAPLEPPPASAGNALERAYGTHTERLKGAVREMWEGMRHGTNTEE
jgi:hypothetical protein